MNDKLVKLLIDGCEELTEEQVLYLLDDSETDAPRFAMACVLMACESHERYAEPDGTVGGRAAYGFGEMGMY